MGHLFRRTIWLISVVFAVSVAVFLLVHLSGDPTDGFVDPAATPEVRASIRERLGLDDPLPQQFVRFIGDAARADFGRSWRADQPALGLVLGRLDQTLLLAGGALALALLVGLPLGILHAAASSRAVRNGLDLVISTAQAVPGFWFGAVLILVFAVNLRWLPSSGSGGIRSLVLPSIALAVQPIALIARLTSVQVDATLRADFVRTARGKGLPEPQVLRSHVLREGIGPILALIGVQTGFLISGAVVIEGVFAWPGIGTLALNAVQDRDLPVIQAFVIVTAVLIVALSTVSDLLAKVADPRLRQGVSE